MYVCIPSEIWYRFIFFLLRFFSSCLLRHTVADKHNAKAKLKSGNKMLLDLTLTKSCNNCNGVTTVCK